MKQVLAIRRTRECKAAQNHRGQQGFSMLEAVIAVGVLGLCMLPLLDFQMSVSDGASRLVERQALMEAEGRAIEYLRHVPPAHLATGAADFGDWQLTWREVLRAPVKKALSEQGATARFDVSVVRLEYEVLLPGGASATRELDRLVWMPVTRLFDGK